MSRLVVINESIECSCTSDLRMGVPSKLNTLSVIVL